MSKRLLIIITLICIILSLTACGGNTTPNIPPPEDMSGTPGDVLIPDASDTTTSEPEVSVPDNSTTTPDASKSGTTTSTPANNNSRPTNPPANNTPSQPPANNTPSQPPATSTPTPSQPAKPVYTEADFQKIISDIRKYGEAKGFVWNDSFVFGQAGLGYYGRPNLERDGYDGVVSRLKNHCDKIATDVGVCYFKVIHQVYEGNNEFVVLYG